MTLIPRLLTPTNTIVLHIPHNNIKTNTHTLWHKVAQSTPCANNLVRTRLQCAHTHTMQSGSTRLALSSGAVYVWTVNMTLRHTATSSKTHTHHAHDLMHLRTHINTHPTSLALHSASTKPITLTC